MNEKYGLAPAIKERLLGQVEQSTEKRVVKRNGDVVPLELDKITAAIAKAVRAVNGGELNLLDAELIALDVRQKLPKDKDTYAIEDIQDLVEKQLMAEGMYDVAKAYILYRAKRAEQRLAVKNSTDDLTLKTLASESSKAFDHDPMREFIYMRTYSRWIESLGRREMWPETVDRYVNFLRENIGAALSNLDYNQIRIGILNQMVMPSMRLLQFAGPAATRCNVCAYNCSFSAPECVKDLADIMYLSMSGTGVGFSVEAVNVAKFPMIKPQTKNMFEYTVEDSKEGWCDAFQYGLERWFDGDDVDFDFSDLRPAGARLKTMGGRSSGPKPLMELMTFTREIFQKRSKSPHHNKLTTLDLHDIICKVGQIVVAGGVRRCIAAGSKVVVGSTSFKNIEDIVPGDKVLTYDGWKHVVRTFDQGVQETVKIIHQEGILECTPNHRVATFPDINSPPIWKEASNLTSNDILGFPIRDVVGDLHKIMVGIDIMPDFNYIRPLHSTTCKNIVIPPLDEGMAWLMGNIQGDGYVGLTSKSGEISIAIHADDVDHKLYAEEQLRRFGVATGLTKPKVSDNCFKVRVKSKQLATFLYEHVKQPKMPLKVPEFIKRATPRIKACFIQGLMDADGSIKTRPMLVVTTVYPDYAREIQALFMSIGIMSRFKERPVKEENWQDKYEIAMINNRDKQAFSCWTQGIGFKKGELKSKVQRANGWPVGNIKFTGSFPEPANWRAKVNTNETVNANVPSDSLDLYFGIKSRVLPIKIKEVVKSNSPVHTYDIEVEDNHNFVCNGVLVHNSALISLSDLEDRDIGDCKSGPFWNTNSQRCLANNSAIYDEKPEQIVFMKEWLKLAESGTGERGIFNRGGLKKVMPQRRVHFLGEKVYTMGLNPCAEIILQPFQFCNLTEVICRPTDTLESLKKKVEVATIIGTCQASLSDFKYIDPKWKKNQDIERLLGVSLTGIQDCPELESDDTLKALREHAIITNYEYSMKLGIVPSMSITCVKPSGTVSQMVNSSSGIHPRFSEYYIRRVRISATDPLLQLMKSQGYECCPEVGQVEPNVNTYVLEFPIASPEHAVTADQVTAMEQLENWKRFKTYYTEHNPSVTIYVKSDEWLDVGKWIWDNWDVVTGLSFLPYSDHIYELAPYEAISKERYEKIKSQVKRVDFSKLKYYEKEDTTDVKRELACAGGACELQEVK